MGLNIVLAYYFWYVLVSNFKESKTNNNLALETHSFVSKLLKQSKDDCQFDSVYFVSSLYSSCTRASPWQGYLHSVIPALLIKMMAPPKDGEERL